MVHPDAPALESIATNLDQMIARVAAIADLHREDPDDPLTSQLDDLERSLKSTHRRLTRTIRNLGT